MSIDTVTTYNPADRTCRLTGEIQRNDMREDPTSPMELTDVRIPEIQIENDLGLDVLSQLSEVRNIPQDILFPGEYNLYLQERLKSVCDENRQLSELIKQRDKEIAETKEKLNSSEQQGISSGSQALPLFEGLGPIRHADMAACRVMDLSKQVCELTAQLEEQRARCALAELKLMSIVGCQGEREPITTEIIVKKDAEIKALIDKLHVANSKWFECRNKIHHLQQELKTAQKVLSCEVGEGVSIADLISSSGSAGGWRGRAQQIQILQQRVADLTDRLRKSYDHSRLESTLNLCAEGKCASKERKASLEVAMQETRTTQHQLNEYTRKLDAAKARIKVLQSENCSFKTRIQFMNDKGSRDNELIHILQDQIGQLQSALQLSKNELRKSEKYYQQLLDDQRLEKQRSLQLLSNMEEKEKQIKHLEEMLFDMKDKEINSLKREAKSDQKTVELVEVSPSISCASPANKVEQDSPKVTAAEVECKKLLELVNTVNRRLNDARHECDNHKRALRLERQRLARLEAKLARQEMDRIGSFCMARRQTARRKASAIDSQEGNISSTEKMQDKLELLQEEVLTLKTRLSCLEQEKDHDLQSFAAILNGASHQTLTKPS